MFCKIAQGEAPASIVYEDERIVAFCDLHPAADHHVLVVPRQHATGLAELDPMDAAGMLPVAQRIADAIRASDPSVEGISLGLADGAAAGQDVSHVHMHVISRRTGDSIEYLEPVAWRPTRDELDARAAQVRAQLNERTHPIDRLRAGDRPRTSAAGPHRQLDQQAPPELWGALVARIFALPGVREGHSGVSLPTSRALLLVPDDANGPEEAFLGGTEFAHVHAVSDTSLRLCLPIERGARICELGWGEPHGYAEQGTEIMVYGPRDRAELEVVVSLVRESMAFARGARIDE